MSGWRGHFIRQGENLRVVRNGGDVSAPKEEVVCEARKARPPLGATMTVSGHECRRRRTDHDARGASGRRGQTGPGTDAGTDIDPAMIGGRWIQGWTREEGVCSPSQVGGGLDQEGPTLEWSGDMASLLGGGPRQASEEDGPVRPRLWHLDMGFRGMTDRPRGHGGSGR